MKGNKLLPELRFPGFEGEWEEKRLGEIAKKIKTKNTLNNISEVFSNSATLGIVLQREYFERDIANQNNLAGYYIVEPDHFVYNPRLSSNAEVGAMSVNHTGLTGLVSPLYTVFKVESDRIINSFLEKTFNSKVWHNYMKSIANYGARDDRMNIRDDDFFMLPLNLPSLPEQQKIADFLSSVDKKIELLENQLKLQEEYKKGMMQKLFSQQIRFKDEYGKDFPDWEERLLSDVLFEHNLKSNNTEEVCSVSVHKGVINQVEHLGRVFAASDTSNYNLVKPGDIIYTKSPTGDFPYGIIKMSKQTKNVIVSPLYGVFTPESYGLGYILDVYFESNVNTYNYLASIVQKGAKNTINITNRIFLSKSLILPISKEEQQKIADFLSSLDKKINNTKQQLEKAKDWKKGLMQQMFV